MTLEEFKELCEKEYDVELIVIDDRLYHVVNTINPIMVMQHHVSQDFLNKDTTSEIVRTKHILNILGMDYNWKRRETSNPITPNHYKGTIETIDYMKSCLTLEEFKGYLKGNILKYTSRADKKNKLEDYKKAQWHMNYLINFLEENNEQRN